MKYTCTKCGKRHENKISALMCHPNIELHEHEKPLSNFLEMLKHAMPESKFRHKVYSDSATVFYTIASSKNLDVSGTIDIELGLLDAHHRAGTIHQLMQCAVTEINYRVQETLERYEAGIK
jgi:hypothetical protein